MALLFNINFYNKCKTRVYLIVPCRHEKIYFAQESFYLPGILNDINEQDTSFLDCKHKHMMKRGAPPDKFRVLYCIFTYRISWFHKQNYFLGLSLFGSGLNSIFFRNNMGSVQCSEGFTAPTDLGLRSRTFL